MKTKYLIPILFFLFPGCAIDTIDEIPDEIFILTPYPDLVDSIGTYFPDSKNIYVENFELFSDSAEKNIVLINESEVYVTFMNETASNKNTLCWYSYDQNISIPLSSSDITTNVLFPNISKIDEGGQLKSGNTLQLGSGSFPPGTVIGFMLIEDGWQDDGSINFSLPKYYTDFNLNSQKQQQHILFKFLNFKYLLIGFEDKELGKDFNDIIFAVTDNREGYEATSFDLNNVIIIE